MKKSFFLMIASLSFLFGCDKGESLLPSHVSHITIEYINKESNEGYSIIMANDKSEDIKAFYKDTILVEILSLTEDSVEIEPSERSVRGFRNVILFGTEKHSVYNPRGKRSYTIKYKVPSIRGEIIEEVELTFNEDHDYFIEAWYNGEAIPLVTDQMIHPGSNDPQYIFDKEEWLREEIEFCKTDDVVAKLTQSNIHILVPIK